jgi:uncharacterized protein
MAERSSRQSGVPVDYYAPNYRIEVRGHVLDETTKGDILNLEVTMQKDELAGFMLTVNNWDDVRLRFKYSDTDTFDVGNSVYIHMGYADRLVPMMRGIITSMTPSFPESGSPTLGVSGSDALIRLKGRKPSPDDIKAFEKKTDSEIPKITDWEVAKIVVERNHLKFKGTGKDKSTERASIVQKDQDELSFLLARAKDIDFDCFMGVDPKTGEDVVHFESPTDARDGRPVKVYVFTWGESLIRFNPVLTIKDQVGTVTVRGWDPYTKQPISYTARPQDLPHPCGTGVNGPEIANKTLDKKRDLVVDRPVLSIQEAHDYAVALLRERSYGFLTGTCQVIGLPDLRPGDNVELKKLGTRFSGCYHVLKVTHSLGGSGYLTNFEVRA